MMTTKGDSEEDFPQFCGIENNCIVNVDFIRKNVTSLKPSKAGRTEFKSPWYSATFFLKDPIDYLVVGEEGSGETKCFYFQNNKTDGPISKSEDD
mmetsp:Transcript_21243/g.32906  ORF Transcript_21243/g.32906 Transcript_21243/m.32906 type:complete len:95 (+) Transcript_21243:1966-2250(+)